MKDRILTYDDLKLGEKAKDAFLRGETPDYIRKHCPIYLNTNTLGGIAELNTTDLIVAAVLAGMNSLISGRYGSGKSQLARDIHNHYFGGSKSEGGEAVEIDVNPETNITDPSFEIYTKFSTNSKGEKTPPVILSKNVSAFYHFIDEINRTPTIKQNQFYGPLNGHVTHEGKSVRLGRDDFRAVVATANIGNGLYEGTFQFDPALRNRFGIIIDTNYSVFEPTEDDRGLVALLTESDPSIKEAPKRNISELILKANKEIRQASLNLSVDEQAVLWYLEEGLRFCLKKKDGTGLKEGEFWFTECRDCTHNPETNRAICHYMSSPVRRTIEATRLYSSALAYLIKLKNPNSQVQGTDIMFKAFELTSAYQPFINPDAVQAHKGDFGKVSAEASYRLKGDFGIKRDYICSTLESAREGEDVLFGIAKRNIGNPIKFEKGKIYAFSDGKVFLNKDDFEEFNPFEEPDRVISLGWVRRRAELLKKIKKFKGK